MLQKDREHHSEPNYRFTQAWNVQSLKLEKVSIVSFLQSVVAYFAIKKLVSEAKFSSREVNPNQGVSIARRFRNVQAAIPQITIPSSLIGEILKTSDTVSCASSVFLF